MCGIVGTVNWPAERSVIEGMTEVLQARGPDQSGVHVDTYAQLGHRRLAVIDVEGGRQPMHYTVGEEIYTIVYNGELYNTEALRQQLQQLGYVFQTRSDTEVVLVSFIAWREQCVQRLDGIFAFAVSCEARRELFLCRDRLGVKPLYYIVRGQALAFASEMKALFIHPHIIPTVDKRGLSSLLSIGPSHRPGETVYKGVQELQPAHFLLVNDKGMRVARYWHVETVEHPHSLAETIDVLRGLIVDSVEKQLVSDVPLCTFLSGGIDSSAITAIAANYYQQTGNKLHTYSVDYEGNELFFEKNDFQVARDEYYIDMMRKEANTEHHFVVITQQELVDSLEMALCLKDYPSMADIDSSLYLFCRAVKEQFTVALSGECADELFGGYPWFYQQAEQFPWIRSIAAREALLKPEWRERLQLRHYSEDSYEQAVDKRLTSREQLFALNRDYFMQTLLERKDRMSMGAGLEVRVPFADHQLVDYVWSIPWEMKYVDGYEKGILRKAMAGLVPDEVLYRKKNPYPKTHHPLYAQLVCRRLRQCLEDRSSILHELFDQVQLKQVIDTEGQAFSVPWFGQLMSGPQLLAYFLQVHYWVKRYGVSFV